MDNPHVDGDTTGKPNTYVFYPTDVQIHEFFFEGDPNPKDLEGVEEDKILEIHRTFQQKLKERDVERERNITKKIQEYEQKYNFINKALVIWVINSFFKYFVVLHTFINDDGKTYAMAYTNYVVKCISRNVYKERSADSSFRG